MNKGSIFGRDTIPPVSSTLYSGGHQLTVEWELIIKLSGFRVKFYLEVEDDGPYQAKDNWWSSIGDVSGMNVNKFDLKQKTKQRIMMENSSGSFILLSHPQKLPEFPLY